LPFIFSKIKKTVLLKMVKTLFLRVLLPISLFQKYKKIEFAKSKLKIFEKNQTGLIYL